MKMRALGFTLPIQYGLIGLVLAQLVINIMLGLYALEKDQLEFSEDSERLNLISMKVDEQLLSLGELIEGYQVSQKIVPVTVQKIKDSDEDQSYISVSSKLNHDNESGHQLQQYEELAEHFIVHKRWQDALEVYEKLGSINDSSAYQYNKAVCLDNLARYEEAKVVYKNLIEKCRNEQCLISMEAVSERLSTLGYKKL